jgi:hypothetical protein
MRVLAFGNVEAGYFLMCKMSFVKNEYKFGKQKSKYRSERVEACKIGATCFLMNTFLFSFL